MEERIPKVLFVGDSNTGKTSIVRRIVGESIKGINFFTKDSPIGNNMIPLQLCDVSQDKKYIPKMLDSYVVAVFIIVDAMNPDSLEGAREWKKYIEFYWNVLTILLVNKIDLVNEGKGLGWREKLTFDQFCQEYCFYKWSAVCASTGLNLPSVFNQMLEVISKRQHIVKLLKRIKEKLCKEKLLDS
jgi:GTPase SAR1 family protein